MEPYLPTLIPKLYRSSYDPNPRLAQAMNNILGMLMEPRKAVEKYDKQIPIYSRANSQLNTAM